MIVSLARMVRPSVRHLTIPKRFAPASETEIISYFESQHAVLVQLFVDLMSNISADMFHIIPNSTVFRLSSINVNTTDSIINPQGFDDNVVVADFDDYYVFLTIGLVLIAVLIIMFGVWIAIKVRIYKDMDAKERQ
eukprot:553980_1